MCNCIDEGVGPISLQGLIESVQCCMWVGSRQLEIAKSEGCQGLSMIEGSGYSSGADRQFQRGSIYYQNGCKVPVISQMAGSSWL